MKDVRRTILAWLVCCWPVVISGAQPGPADEEPLPLKAVTRDGVAYRHFDGPWFVLESTTDEDTTRRMVARIDRVLTHCRDILSPRARPKSPVRLVVFGVQEQYDRYLKQLGCYHPQLRSCGLFLPEKNLVVVASSWNRFQNEARRVEAEHEQLRAQLKQMERQMQPQLEQIRKQMELAGTPSRQITGVLKLERARYLRQIQAKRKELDVCDRRNEGLFVQAAGQTLSRLGHETAHAYMENYVFPQATCRVPYWLAEGFAMLAEREMSDQEASRCDLPYSVPLAKLQEDLARNTMLPLADLLAAQARQFVVTDQNQAEVSNRYYCASWGLVHYLAFQYQHGDHYALRGKSLDDYVVPNPGDSDAVRRFEALVGASLAPFEACWHAYLKKLK